MGGSVSLPVEELPQSQPPWGLFDERTNNKPDGYGPILYNAQCRTADGKFALKKTLPTGEQSVVEVFLESCKRGGDRVCAGFRKLIKTHMVAETPGGKEFEKLEFENKYTWLTCKQYKAKVFDFAAGFDAFAEKIGERNKAKKSFDRSKVVVYAETQVDWLACALAALSRGLPIVTIYATLGEDGAKFAMNQTKAEVVICDSKLVKVLVAIAKDLPNLKYVITMGGAGGMGQAIDASILAKLPPTVKVTSVSDCISNGAALRGDTEDYMTPTPDDLAVIMYTSGTTGPPKGVMMSHGNFVACIVSATRCLSILKLDECPPGVTGGLPDQGAKTVPNRCLSCRAEDGGPAAPGSLPDNVFMACLPMAHIMELAVEVVCINKGVALAYGSPHTLTPAGVKLKVPESKGDAELAQPTFMVLPPAVLEKVYAKIMEGANAKWISSWLFNYALEQGDRSIATGEGIGASKIANSIVFAKPQALLGGRLKAIGSGSAPLSAELHKALQTIFSCPIRIGYGLTETMAIAVVGEWPDMDFGVCGPPTESCMLRLADWPDGNYLNADVFNKAVGMPRGEVLIGGPLVTLGYYQDPSNPDPELVKKNKEEYVEMNGARWFRTGDIGQINRNGVLQIIDRKKDLWKGPQGEYVALSKIENIMKLLPFVDNAMMYGKTGGAFPVLFVVPNEKALAAIAAECGSSASGLEALCTDAKVAEAVKTKVNAHCKEAKMVAFEFPQKIHLCKDVWAPEINELLTAQLKLKRPQIVAFYKNEIDKMYA
ncbi:unnamed protein product [Amoebophrya sp. A25]|nr:unnamed protein product [Amoebophrya sp. A25]|eukprot:GSA25T00020032001.1